MLPSARRRLPQRLKDPTTHRRRRPLQRTAEQKGHPVGQRHHEEQKHDRRPTEAQQRPTAEHQCSACRPERNGPTVQRRQIEGRRQSPQPQGPSQKQRPKPGRISRRLRELVPPQPQEKHRQRYNQISVRVIRILSPHRHHVQQRCPIRPNERGKKHHAATDETVPLPGCLSCASAGDGSAPHRGKGWAAGDANCPVASIQRSPKRALRVRES